MKFTMGKGESYYRVTDNVLYVGRLKEALEPGKKCGIDDMSEPEIIIEFLNEESVQHLEMFLEEVRLNLRRAIG